MLPSWIGQSTELVGRTSRPHRCSGTWQGDMPDPRFRFNVLFVRHDEPFPLHGHEYAELVVVLGGRGLHRTGHGTHPVEAGDVFVVHGAERHGFPEAEGLRLCNLQYDPRQCFRNVAELGRLPGFHALFGLAPRSGRPAPPRLRLSSPQLAYVEGLLRSLEQEFRGSMPGRRDVVRALFLLLAVHLSRLAGSRLGPASDPLSRMAGVLAYARTHFREPVRVADLARIAHLSPSQFQRAFKQACRTTPARFLSQLRVEEAAELLRDSRAKLSVVAREAGFGSAAFFSTQFRRFTGVTPREYRRRLQGDPA